MSNTGLFRDAGLLAEADRHLSPEHAPLDVSVCIANYHCRDLLRDCLRSLLDQSQDLALEIIVVDNASSDGAADMVAREFPQVHLIRNDTNRGFSRANNQAADLARGRHLFFLNNDTMVPPGALRYLVDYADRHPDIGMIGPRCRDGQGKVQASFRRRPTLMALLHKTVPLRWTGLFKRAHRRFRHRHFDPDAVCNVDVLMGAAVLVPRQRFFACGRWDEEFAFGGEDSELSARMNRIARVVYLPQAEILHFGRVSSRLHIGYASSQLASGWVRYFRKAGYGRLPVFIYKAAVTVDAPLQLAGKTLQGTWRWLTGRHVAAQRSWLAARGTWQFLARGLPSFWRT
jgi:N-acetylglucosaminyl-diphospho-decaprenol L-rhamnosyltransferase